jgi:hypothetical protein
MGVRLSNLEPKATKTRDDGLPRKESLYSARAICPAIRGRKAQESRPMQYELQIFQYESDFQFRTMDINGENWPAAPLISRTRQTQPSVSTMMKRV